MKRATGARMKRENDPGDTDDLKVNEARRNAVARKQGGSGQPRLSPAFRFIERRLDFSER